MNLKPIIICLVVVLTLSLFSCSADPERLIIVADVDNSIGNQEIEIIAGGSLVIHLDSNPTTGFSWRLTGISHQNVVSRMASQSINLIKNQLWGLVAGKYGLSGHWQKVQPLYSWSTADPGRTGSKLASNIT